MKERIDEVLLEIEASEGVTILYACESGSRAWGFASADSDFDVRFLYLHPPLVEWLGSPIVYREDRETASRLRSLLPEFYSTAASGYHYLHMAQGNFREYLKGDVVWRKKYFYVLRPVLRPVLAIIRPAQ